jgi:[ribosomal protein S5]-alanine N-acetyltransferase|tara:strand:+ start:74 stop:244 length:171 start_codon:yes stop_codon:yes gene_type:complete
MLEPLETERLLIRTPVPSDAAELAIRRSNPTLAEFQNWSIPYTLQQAIELLAKTGL